MTNNKQKAILIIGVNGMLGQDLVKTLSNANYNILTALVNETGVNPIKIK